MPMPAPVAGLSPTSPLIVEVGTSVISVPARIANGWAVWSETSDVAAAPAPAIDVSARAANAPRANSEIRGRVRRDDVPRGRYLRYFMVWSFRSTAGCPDRTCVGGLAPDRPIKGGLSAGRIPAGHEAAPLGYGTALRQ